MRQLARVGNVVRAQRAHLSAFQCQQRERVPFVADELHFERRAIAMHQYGGAHVAAHQPVLRQVARQGYRVQFVDRGKHFIWD